MWTPCAQALTPIPQRSMDSRSCLLSGKRVTSTQRVVSPHVASMHQYTQVCCTLWRLGNRFPFPFPGRPGGVSPFGTRQLSSRLRLAHCSIHRRRRSLRLIVCGLPLQLSQLFNTSSCTFACRTGTDSRPSCCCFQPTGTCVACVSLDVAGVACVSLPGFCLCRVHSHLSNTSGN